jgi:hypothetical protein
VLVVGGGEDHFGQVVVDFFQQVESGHAGHLDVEKKNFGREFADHVNSFVAVFSFADDFDFGVGAEQAPQFEAGERLVID